ncbi:bifunctional diaminohydroxyphosphoribosylaminopyrimidine deaminase/5-amino-6-(5-phosphoribosylamino)uracil reductase RibD [Bacillus chungangensis]|uniref:Riboflavin biosynthesis protein RibD n=1 Tax=Bacillus chungangensis TaxID=587633 RepID=A0ABT9WW10_9BACI|nr:bifunctional diaminohydroxyphosphoribosylaminopyrimidine deaminase/5-amino-6-(5-phosphoribosylamino)uracil reductase RibD [Bacillus chungangensis]MDQ0177487.1 diaminohydroxyphosphoribosylaminopyrimidine deaminase/5-amino-6-(5-phosphoribosylamino)uracil reductase [Bacillus chungangensis]
MEVMNPEDIFYMRQAICLAKIAGGQTSPNPMVGAVIVKNGEIVGIGTHLKAGENHAEIHALHMAGKKAIGATLYVTLEPCSHSGKTPPCVDAIIQAGIARVVIAMEDPNPLVSGKGISTLMNHYISVSVGVLEEQAKQLNECYCFSMKTKKPFVCLKTSSTLDGKITDYRKGFCRITSDHVKKEVHELRRKYDAILVGINTIIHDDPLLTVREIPTYTQPIKVILDSNLKIPIESKVFQNEEGKTIIFTTDHASPVKEQALKKKGAKVFRTGKVMNLHKVMKILYSLGVISVLVEGGGNVNFSFLKENLVNKVIIYKKLNLIGGKNAITLIDGEGLKIEDAVQLINPSCEKISVDEIKISGYIDRKDGIFPIEKLEKINENEDVSVGANNEK